MNGDQLTPPVQQGEPLQKEIISLANELPPWLTLPLKFPLSLGLVFAISLLFLQAQHVAAQAPSPSASPRIDLNDAGLIAPNFDPDISRSPRFRDWSPDRIYLRQSTYVLPLPEGEPTPEPEIDQVRPILVSPPDPAQSPSLSPSDTLSRVVVPVPPVARESEDTRTALFNIPPPNPLPSIPPPPVPAAAPFVSGRPYLQRSARALPRVQVSRTESDVPQNVVRRRGRFEPLLVTGNEPVRLHLYFHPSLAGQTLEVLADDSFTGQPPNQFLLIGPTGEAVLVLELGAAKSRGEIALRVDSITTALHFLRAPLRALLAKERATKGAAQ